MKDAYTVGVASHKIVGVFLELPLLIVRRSNSQELFPYARPDPARNLDRT